MHPRVLVIAVWAATAALTVTSARAQRRDHGPATGVFRIELKAAVRFGDVVVPARTYRLTLSDKGFALADMGSMVLIATLPVEETTGHVTVTPPKVEVTHSGKTVTLVMQHSDRVYRATGTATASVPADRSLVTLAGKSERVVEAARSASETTDVDMVMRALDRYRRSLKHCADSAHRSRWRTDDPRFVRCVCPIVTKLRLPRVSAPVRVHRPLAKGRSGFSITATVEGKASDCRVWIGSAPPGERATSTAEAPAAVPAVLPTRPVPAAVDSAAEEAAPEDAASTKSPEEKPRQP